MVIQSIPIAPGSGHVHRFSVDNTTVADLVRSSNPGQGLELNIVRVRDPDDWDCRWSPANRDEAGHGNCAKDRGAG